MQKVNQFTVLRRISRILAAGCIMAASAIIMKHVDMPFVPNVLVSAAIYGILLVLFREPLIKIFKNRPEERPA